MRKKEHIVRYSAEELTKLKSESDWAKADAMTREEVERRADEEDGPLPADWESTVVLGIPEPAKPVHIRLDAEVLRWFKADGPGYQTRINEVLKKFVQNRQKATTKQPSPE